MKIKTLIDIPKTVDGEKVGPFAKGQEFDLDKKLAEKFIGSAMAEEVLPPKPAMTNSGKKSADKKATSKAAEDTSSPENKVV